MTDKFAETGLYASGAKLEFGTPSTLMEFLGFFSFETAWRTLQGFEVMNMLRKGQLQGVEKGDVRSQVELVAKLFGAAA
ncbi:hypothetical protein KSF_003430 [Reticulibacter mediterranei]|uniref:Uncharacterized protein n=1 Tax=Reticulibacter mediterranei TaxID=2778369 RepID=A0A8J3MZK1_9CHLR|nr:hypothetical protein KSF_003430 [Reticulibacter mediterranei]